MARRLGQLALQIDDRVLILVDLHGDARWGQDAQLGLLGLQLAQVGAIDLEQIFDMGALSRVHKKRTPSA